MAKVVSEANPSWEKHKHPATRAFQGIRIFINRELADLKEVLDTSLELLKPGGRLVVISFHSLEDRIVKRFMRRMAKGANIPRGVPIAEQDIVRPLRLVGKAVKASAAEISDNPRARSAVLRVAERTAGAADHARA